MAFLLVFFLNKMSWGQAGPYSLPSKKNLNTGPEEISPQKGDTDPLNKRNQQVESKKVLGPDNEVSEFVGVVQFLKGTANWSETERQDPIKFKTLFHWNESLLVDTNSYLKLITRGRCVAIVYGKSQLQSPLPSAETAWNLVGGSLRWICGPDHSDTVRVDGHALHLADSEILYHRQKLYVVRGQVKSESGELSPQRTYSWQDNQWKLEFSQEDAFRSWKLSQELEAPKESLPLEKPPRNIRSRWSIGPVFGPGEIKHPNYRYGIEKPKIEGARLQANFKWKDRSVIAGLTYSELKRADEENDYKFNSNVENDSHNRLESFLLELGLRSQHESSWSWNYRIGVGKDTLSVNSHSSSYGLNRRIISYSGRIAFGIDKIFFADRLDWGGLLLSAEFFYHQALKYRDTLLPDNEYISNSTSPSPIEDNDAKYKAWGILIYLAPMLQF